MATAAFHRLGEMMTDTTTTPFTPSPTLPTQPTATTTISLHPPTVIVNTDVTNPDKQQWRLTALHQLLDGDLRYHIEYASAAIDPTARFLSNHLPHGLIALYALGASGERLVGFSETYAKHTLEPALTSESADSMHIDDTNWQQCLGQRRYFLAYTKFLDTKLKEYGDDLPAARRLIAEFMPLLLPGSSNAALHPLIHTGWACAGPWPESRTTLLEGLAYRMYSYFPMNKERNQSYDYTAEAFATTPHADSKSVLQVLQSTITTFQPLLADIQIACTSPPISDLKLGKFQRSMHAIGSFRGKTLLDCDIQLQIPTSRGKQGIDATAHELFTAAVVLYTCSNNDFFMLHATTSSFAFSHIVGLLSTVDEQAIACRHALKFVLATYIAQSLPVSSHPVLLQMIERNDFKSSIDDLLAYESQYTLLPWDECIEFGKRTDDEHTQKLIWVLHDYATQSEDAMEQKLAQLAASKRVQVERGDNAIGKSGVVAAVTEKVKTAVKQFI